MTPDSRHAVLDKRVLIDVEHLLRLRGTGLATYARNLSYDLVAMGASLSALVDVEFSPRRGNGSANLERWRGPKGPEAMSRWLPMSLRRALATSDDGGGIRRYLIGLAAKPFGAAAGVLPADDILRPEGAADARFATAFAVKELKLNARQHAIRWGKPMPLRFDEQNKPDLTHVTQLMPVRVPGRPLIATIHDIIPVVMPGALRTNPHHERLAVQALLRHADHVVTVSEHARNDLIRHCGGDPDRISTTFQPHGVTAQEIAAADAIMDECLRFHGLDHGEYFIFCGSIEPKKNVARLVDAFAGAGVRRPLILVGGLGWSYDADIAAIDSDRFIRLAPDGAGFRQERLVRRLQHLPRIQMLALLRGARAMVFPSLYEGFGLPAVEAMAVGTPVIASRTTALGEITQGAAIHVDPLDVMDIARAIRTVDADADRRAELREAGFIRASEFSPDRHRARLDAIYARVL